MFVAIVNDSSDANAAGRQATRVASLVEGAAPIVVGVPAYATLAAGGMLVDMLDASGGREGAVLVNVAPRHTAHERSYANGSPFAYTWVGRTLIIATVEGYTLSLAKLVGAFSEPLYLLDVSHVAEDMVGHGLVSAQEASWMAHTQFRSYEFSPRLAAAMLQGYEPPKVTELSLNEIPLPPPAVWWVDNFGNLKTTWLPEHVSFTPGLEVATHLGTFRCFEQLADVPPGELGFVRGSSGYGEHRFVEVVAQGANAAEMLQVDIGEELAPSEGSGAA